MRAFCALGWGAMSKAVSYLFDISDIVDGVIFNYNANDSNLSKILPNIGLLLFSIAFLGQISAQHQHLIH